MKEVIFIIVFLVIGLLIPNKKRTMSSMIIQEGDMMKGEKFTIEILGVCGKVVFPRIIHNGKYFGDVKVTTVKDLVEDGYKKIIE